MAIAIIEASLVKDARVLAEPFCSKAITAYCTGDVILMVPLWVSADDYCKARPETLAAVCILFEAEGIRMDQRPVKARRCPQKH